ncbi:MAG: protein kinase [Myxococcales bacterium]|nr:protein kinase [Myxococcales bacterium]
MTAAGQCPGCDARGVVGAPCEAPTCRDDGLHLIPEAFAAKLHPRGTLFRDPNLGQLISDFLVVDVLGRGSYGRVYLTLQRPLWMKTALKLLATEFSDPDVRREVHAKFEREALSLSRLAHPNIVRLIQYGFWDDKPFMAMELVEGARTLKHDLDEQIERGVGFDAPIVAHVIQQVLNGLACAHEQQIIHRDIKPENLLRQSVKGDDRFVRIVDFGLAKFTEQTRNTAYILGTPAYMAPEQVSRTNIGPWTDLYAVGAIVIEMLTGRWLFSSGTAHEVMALKADRSFDPLADLRALALPEPLVAFFGKALAFDPAERHRSVDEFRSELWPLLAALDSAASRGADDPAGLRGSAERLERDVERVRLEEENRRLSEERREIDRQREQLAREKRDLERIRQRLSNESAADPETTLDATETIGPEAAPPAGSSAHRYRGLIALIAVVVLGGALAVAYWRFHRRPAPGDVESRHREVQKPPTSVSKAPSPLSDPVRPPRRIPGPGPAVTPRRLPRPTPDMEGRQTPTPTSDPRQLNPRNCDAICSHWRGCLVRTGRPAETIAAMVDFCEAQCSARLEKSGTAARVLTDVQTYCRTFAPTKGRPLVDESALRCSSLCAEAIACYERIHGVQAPEVKQNECVAECEGLRQRSLVGMLKVKMDRKCSAWRLSPAPK